MSTTPDSVFQKAVESAASDIHVAVGSPLMFRIDGILTPQTKGNVTTADAERFVKGVLGQNGWKKLEADREIDVAYPLKSGVRLRVNCHFERGNVGLVARIIPTDIPTLADLQLEQVAESFIHRNEGLVLFTGPTGTGKSTSMASIIRHISEARPVSVVTMEDPIEFIFPQGQGVIRQRQFGQDFHSFPEALKRVLRQDPDIVMLGEMRDPETIAAALTLAETGHLIFGTLHTPNAVQTVDRIIDVFPPHQQPQIRSQLSMSLKAVVAQRLLPAAKGGRIAQREILINTPAASNIIRDNRLAELKSVLQTGSDMGMISFEKDLKRLYKEGLISKEVYEMVEGEG
jgi:twitching motility protein PilT